MVVLQLQNTKIITKTTVDEIKLGNGSVNISINLLDELFYKVLTEISGVQITNEADLFSTITTFANTKREYDKIASALEHVKATDYGIVTPTIAAFIF